MRSPLRGSRFILWRAGGLPGLTRRDGTRVVLAGVVIVVGYHVFLNLGTQHTTSGVAALVVALAPGMTLVLAVLVGLERLHARRILGLALALAGVAIVVALGTGEELSLESAKGPLLVLGAPLSFAFYNVVLKPLLARYDLLALTAATSLVGTLGLIPFLRGSTSTRRRASRRTTSRSSSTSGFSRRSSATSDGTSACAGSARRARSRSRMRSPRLRC